MKNKKEEIYLCEGIALLETYSEILYLLDSDVQKIKIVEAIKKLLEKINDVTDLDTFEELIEEIEARCDND